MKFVPTFQNYGYTLAVQNSNVKKSDENEFILLLLLLKENS